MGRKKLLKKLSEFFSLDRRARARRREELWDILSRLKKKEVELREKLDAEMDEQKRRELQAKIDVIYKQRSKGISLLKEMKEG